MPRSVAYVILAVACLAALLYLVRARRRDRGGSPQSTQTSDSAALRQSPGRPLALDLSLQDQIRTLAATAGKITAIKRVRELTGLGLKDAKDAVDAIVDGQPLRARSGPVTTNESTGSLAERARQLKTASGPIHAIKLVREETGMSLAEAKAFVDALL